MNKVFASARSNQHTPQSWHNHYGLSMSTVGPGTAVRNPEGATYTVGEGQVLLFDDNVYHMAPKLPIDRENPIPAMQMYREDPRVCFIVGSP